MNTSTSTRTSMSMSIRIGIGAGRERENDAFRGVRVKEGGTCRSMRGRTSRY